MRRKNIWHMFFRTTPTKVLSTGMLMGTFLIGTLLIKHFLKDPSCEEVKDIFYSNAPIVSPVSDSQKVLLHYRSELEGYYEGNNYPLLWIDKDKMQLLPQGEVLINRIKTSYLEGLNPINYHFGEVLALQELIEESHSSMDNVTAALLDVLLTDAYVMYTSDHYAGHVHNTVFNTEWDNHMKEINPLDSLKRISQGIEMNKLLNSFACPFPQYRKLQNVLREYYLNDKEVNIKSDECITRISLNMERWRWLQRNVPDLYVMANTANFSLQVIDHGKEALHMKIISGKLQQPTPLFQARLSYLILNPWWEVPLSIARKEMLPELKKDPSYLSKNHINLYSYKKEDTTTLYAENINWDTISQGKFYYRLRQTPGPWNALGQVKFIFPNKYDVYFHDTPQRELFSKEVRAFSHGCIRLEKPVELAALLLKKETNWIQTKIKSRQEIILSVPSSPTVYICYWTAWVNGMGQLHEASDLYNYDKLMEELWNEPVDIMQEPLLTQR